VLVFHKGDTIDGGTGTDVLLVKGGSLDELFGADGKLDSNITNTEVLVSGNDASTMESLTDVSKLSAIGLTVGAGRQGNHRQHGQRHLEHRKPRNPMTGMT